MITFFTTAKPFTGHSGVIQRNAVHSWTLLFPGTEVILFGDDPGAAEISAELNIRHEPHVERNSFGSKRLDYMFDRAQEIARHDVLCYLNCDIILTRDFPSAIQQLQSRHRPFLMVGRRWDTNITEPLNFLDPQWEAQVRDRALSANDQRPPWWIDYFSFSRGLYLKQIPPLVIGRVYWDNWLIWKAASLGADIVDASATVLAIHQNHDYGYHPKGQQGVWTDEQSQENFRLSGGHRYLRTIESAQFLLKPTGLKNNPFHSLSYLRITARRLFTKSRMNTVAFLQSWFWHPLLRITRPLRHRLGLRASAGKDHH